MIEDLLGRRVSLPIRRLTSFGAFLAVDPVGDNDDTILLPNHEISGASHAVDDLLEVFVYLDSDERPVATLREPKITLGEVAFLEVAEVGEVGAFVDWGMGKELLVPFAEQARELAVGEHVAIGLYLDRSGRLAGTTFVSNMLGPPPSGLARDAWIRGEAWRNEPDIGLFVILERTFVGLMPADEPHRMQRGEAAEFRVAHILPDGKLVLSLRKRAHEQLASDADTILEVLSRARTPEVGDRSDPELIRALFGLSKKAFKRAVGTLLKARKVTIDPRGNVIVVSNP